MNGKVYLVGAGPGDPGLITVKAAQILGRADVVIFDRLVNPVLLDRYIRDGAERIYAGKASSGHTLNQSEINRLLIDRAREGKIVVRLHGGDPFVFGRGGEEAADLASEGIPFEIVPGVTSAIAAPAYAGIPVTHRSHNTSFAVVTGHEDPTKAEPTIEWDKLATFAGTLLFLMGMENLEAIVRRLLENGRPPSTPVALVRWGTWPEQETIEGTLGEIVVKVAVAGFRPPAVIIVGSVVGLRSKLRWWDNRPLFGKRVLVTRSREQASALSALLAEQGAEPLEIPVLEIAPPESYEPLDQAIDVLHSYDWVVFTSANGVRMFLQRLSILGCDIRALANARLAAIGPATAAELGRCQIKVDVIPQVYVAEEVAHALIKEGVEGKKVLLPRAEIARDVLPTELEKAGATVDRVVCYRTVPAYRGMQSIRRRLEAGEIDVITFTSSSTVRYTVEGLGADAASLLVSPMVACIGPVTAETARELNIKVDIVATEHTIPGLVQAIIDRAKR